MGKNEDILNKLTEWAESLPTKHNELAELMAKYVLESLARHPSPGSNPKNHKSFCRKCGLIDEYAEVGSDGKCLCWKCNDPIWS